MIVSNRTDSDQTHRIYISSPKSTTDRTGVYILLLLLSLLLILVFYLVYNFISYRRFISSRKKKTYLEKQFNDRLLFVLNQSAEQPPVNRTRSYEELILPSHPIPLQMKRSISNQYHITNPLVSDL